MRDNNNTYELWYLGDYYNSRDSFNEMLIEAYDLMACGYEAGLTVGGVEIFHRSGNDCETVFDYNFADGYDPKTA